MLVSYTHTCPLFSAIPNNVGNCHCLSILLAFYASSFPYDNTYYSVSTATQRFMQSTALGNVRHATWGVPTLKSTNRWSHWWVVTRQCWLEFLMSTISLDEQMNRWTGNLFYFMTDGCSIINMTHDHYIIINHYTIDYWFYETTISIGFNFGCSSLHFPAGKTRHQIIAGRRSQRIWMRVKYWDTYLKPHQPINKLMTHIRRGSPSPFLTHANSASSAHARFTYLGGDPDRLQGNDFHHVVGLSSSGHRY